MDEKGTAPTDQRFGGERPTIARTISALRLGAAALSLAVSVTLAGCAGGDSPMPAGQNFTKDQSDRFVVASRDLPPGYKKVGSESGPVKCDSGHLANQGAPTETGGEAVVRERLLALGAQGCHVSVYEERSDDGNSTSGFRVLAVVFPDPEAASRSLALFRPWGWATSRRRGSSAPSSWVPIRSAL